MKNHQEYSISEKTLPAFEEIVALTNTFCHEHLNQDYADLSLKAAVKLAEMKDFPLSRGKRSLWACAIVYALGKVNFLFDKSNPPYMKSEELAKHFGVSASGASAKANLIYDMLDMMPMHPDWSIGSIQQKSPFTWILMVNGMVTDIRRMPREVQEIAYNQGLIPYIPADRGEE